MKRLLFITSLVILFFLVGCNKNDVSSDKKEEIVKEYKHGDVVEVEGVNYKLYSVNDLLSNETIWSIDNASETMYGAYYLDILNYKDYPEIPSDIFENEFRKPTSDYEGTSINLPYLNVRPYVMNNVSSAEELVWVAISSNSETIKNDVVVPSEIGNYRVHAIGSHVFLRNNLNSLTVLAEEVLFYPFSIGGKYLSEFNSNGGIFLPYAYSNFNYSDWIYSNGYEGVNYHFDSNEIIKINLAYQDIDSATYLFDNSFYNLHCEIEANIIPISKLDNSKEIKPYSFGIYNLPFSKCAIYKFTNSHATNNNQVVLKDNIYYLVSDSNYKKYDLLGRRANYESSISDNYCLYNYSSLLYSFNHSIIPNSTDNVVEETVFNMLLKNPRLKMIYIVNPKFDYEALYSYEVKDNFLYVTDKNSNETYRTIAIPSGVKIFYTSLLN